MRERTLSELSLSTGRGAEDGAAGTAENYGLGVREDGSDVEATGALDVHEVRVRGPVKVEKCEQREVGRNGKKGRGWGKGGKV